MSDLDIIVKGLLNGKKPPVQYFRGEASEKLAIALSARIDSGVAPSLCAHAMCGSASVGNVAVVKMLADRPMSTFNKAYDLSMPLERAVKAFLRSTDDSDRNDLRECAKYLVAARASLDKPDKHSSSKMTVAKRLIENNTIEALELLKDLRDTQNTWENHHDKSSTLDDKNVREDSGIDTKPATGKRKKVATSTIPPVLSQVPSIPVPVRDKHSDQDNHVITITTKRTKRI